MTNKLPRSNFGKPGRKIHNPSAKFALKNKMITPEEYEACLSGDMEITSQGRRIFNANKDLPYFPTGMYQMLFLGRADTITINKILGITEAPCKPT